MIVADLEAAYPHLLAAFGERLLSDEVVDEVSRGRWERTWPKTAWLKVADDYDGMVRLEMRDASRADLEAALASIESETPDAT